MEILKGFVFDLQRHDESTNITVNFGETTATLTSMTAAKTYVHAGETTFSTVASGAMGTLTYDDKKETFTYTANVSVTGQTVTVTDTTYRWVVNGSADKDNIDLTGVTKEHTIKGGKGNDTIKTGTGGIAYGEDGDDELIGKGGSTLNGGTGIDTLSSTSNDTLIGGTGADVFFADNSKSGFIKDYSLKDGDVLYVGSAIGSAITAMTVAANGTFSSNNGTNKVTLDGSAGYFAVNLKADDGKQYVAWSGEKATKIDASSLKDDVIIYGTTNTEGDSLYGGSGNDTIYAGAGDTVYGAAGNNQIDLSKIAEGDKRAVVGVGKGKDTITSFAGGFDKDTADQLTIVGGLSSIKSEYAGNKINIKSGEASVEMALTADSTSHGAKVLVNGKKAVFAEDSSSSTLVVSSATYADYYLGTKGTNGGSALDASAVEDAVSIDLSNANVFMNFNQVTGGKGKTTLIGTSGKDTLIAGEGTTSLYGGAGRDSLVGNSAARDTFFMMAGGGNDSISGFTVFDGDNADSADVVNLSAVQSAKLVSGGVQINVNDEDKVLIEGATADQAIGYQIGNSINAAKIGSSSEENNFTYLNGVNYYGGGTKNDTFAFASGDSDNHQVWLDGSKGVTYNSIDVVDGSNSSGDLILAGDSAKNTITGGAGTNSLWGGAGNSADVLTGGSSQNTFFYGLAEGNDTITCGSESDLVNLYNIGLSDVTKAEITDSGVSLEFIDGSKVSVDTGYRDIKFALKDGSTWTANHNTHQWNS